MAQFSIRLVYFTFFHSKDGASGQETSLVGQRHTVAGEFRLTPSAQLEATCRRVAFTTYEEEEEAVLTSFRVNRPEAVADVCRVEAASTAMTAPPPPVNCLGPAATASKRHFSTHAF